MEPKIAPNISEGILSINNWIQLMKTFNRFHSKDTKEVFNLIFQEDAKHLIGKLPIKDWGCFFLNLDNKNQVRFLNFLTDRTIDLTFPKIENWQELAKKFQVQGREVKEEDIRALQVIFKLNEWDVYPHELVWFRRFCLYANNNSLPETYKGDQFGNYQNWADYFPYMGLQALKEFCTGLISYS